MNAFTLNPYAVYTAYGRELGELLEHVLTGDLAADNRAATERQIVRVLGALLVLQQRHQVDEHGRCLICRAPRRTWWRPWPGRSICTVYTALSFHLRQPDQQTTTATWGSP